jgi:hypothetical protein
LWKAVKLAKDCSKSGLPKTLFVDGLEIAINKLSDEFASFFDKKILKLLEEVRIEDEGYNGNNKINADELMLDIGSIKHCLLSLKNKNSGGMDRILQRILLDRADFLIIPLVKLFNLIYYFFFKL